MPLLTGASHVAFTVRDMDASAAWYQRVFGWVELRRLTADEAGSPRVLLLDTNCFFVVGLCQPDDGASGDFDYRTTGLDHFALLVPDDNELARWAMHLEEQGVPSSPCARSRDSGSSSPSRTRTESSSSSGSTPSASDALSGRNELVSYDCGCVQTSGQFDLVFWQTH
jgi:glyoxylase I family protein